MKNNAKTIFWGIFTFIGFFMDFYTFILLLSEKKVEKLFIIIVLAVNFLICSLAVAAFIKFVSAKKKSIIMIENIELTTIGHKNLTRKKNTDALITDMKYAFYVENGGFDLYITFTGEIRRTFGSVRGIELNFSGDSNTGLEQIDAYAFDLLNDPQQQHKIYPELIGGDGLNKRMLFKFINELKKNEKFSFIYHYKWANCVNEHKDYVAAIPPFKYRSTKTLPITIQFKNYEMRRLTVYSINGNKPREERQLFPEVSGNVSTYEYIYNLDDDFDFAIAVFEFITH